MPRYLLPIHFLPLPLTHSCFRLQEYPLDPRRKSATGLSVGTLDSELPWGPRPAVYMVQGGLAKTTEPVSMAAKKRVKLAF